MDDALRHRDHGRRARGAARGACRARARGRSSRSSAETRRRRTRERRSARASELDARARALRDPPGRRPRWREHLENMDYLREGVHLRAMAQKDPLVEYRGEGHAMFERAQRRDPRGGRVTLFHAELDAGGGRRSSRRRRSASAAGNGGLRTSTSRSRARTRSQRRAQRAAGDGRPVSGGGAPASRRSSEVARSRRSSAATTPAGAAPARSTRSATAPDAPRRPRHLAEGRRGARRDAARASPIEVDVVATEVARRELKAPSPPSRRTAIVIDRRPAAERGARDAGSSSRAAASARVTIPQVFAGGQPEKVARVREILTDARYADWAGSPLRSARRSSARPTTRSSPTRWRRTPAGRSSRSSASRAPRRPPHQRTGRLHDQVEAALRTDGPAELAVLFVRTPPELEAELPAALATVAERGSIWVAWPKGVRPRRATSPSRSSASAACRRLGRLQGRVDRRHLVGPAVQVPRLARILAPWPRPPQPLEEQLEEIGAQLAWVRDYL